ncbi:hypothetical protein C8R47DRAFT_178851 [Mycena vitilis]|nr:hypothetical protein C8R47DRAFT_178851 [Mycena vitilis]
MRFAPTLFLFSALVPLVAAHGSPHPTSPSRSLARLQHSERRDLIDLCLNIPDLVLNILGLLGVHVDACLCIEDLDIYLKAHADVDLDNNAIAAITALINAQDGGQAHCEKLPAHSTRLCSTSNPCGFQCDDGYVKNGKECDCDTACGASQMARSMKSRRSTFATYREAKEYCGPSLAVCGVPGSSTAWECLDVTKMNDIHSCGGCPAPPFPQKADHLLGTDCNDISSALPGHVTCESGKCVVRKCETGYVAAGHKCVRAQGEKTRRDGLLGPLHPVTNGVSALSGAGGSSNGARCVAVCIGHVVDPLLLCISSLDLGTTLHNLQPTIDQLGLECAGGSSHGSSSHISPTILPFPTPSSGAGGSFGDDSCLDVCIDGVVHPLQLCLSWLGLGQTIHGLQPLVDGLGLRCGASSPTSSTNPPVSAPTHSIPVTSAHSSSASASSHGGSSLSTPTPSSGAGGPSHGGPCIDVCIPDIAHVKVCGSVLGLEPTLYNLLQPLVNGLGLDTCGPDGPSSDDSCTGGTILTACIKGVVEPLTVCVSLLGLGATLHSDVQPILDGLGLGACAASLPSGTHTAVSVSPSITSSAGGQSSSLTTPAHSSSAGSSHGGSSPTTPTHSSSASVSSHSGPALTTPTASTTPTHPSSAGGSSLTPTPSSGAGGPSHGGPCIDVCIRDIAHVKVCGPVLGLEPTLYNLLQPLVNGLGLDTCGPGGPSSENSGTSVTTLTVCLKGVVQPLKACVSLLGLGKTLHSDVQPILNGLGLGPCSGAAGASPNTPALPAPTVAAAAPLLDLNLNLRRTFRKRHGHFARTDVPSRVLDPALVAPIVSLAAMSRAAQAEDQQSVCAALWGSLTAFLGSTQTVFVLNVKVAVAATKMCQSLIASSDVKLGKLLAQILVELLVVQGNKSPTVPQSTPCRPADVHLPVCALGYYISPWMVCTIGTQALPEDAMAEALTLKPVTCLPSPPVALAVPSLPAKATAPADPTDNVIFHAGALLTGCVKLNMWAGNMNYKQSHAVLEMNAVVNVVLEKMVGGSMLEKGSGGRLGGAVWGVLSGAKGVPSVHDVEALVAPALVAGKTAGADPSCACSGTAGELHEQLQQMVPLYTDFMSAMKKYGLGGAELANLVAARLPERGVELFERLNEL